MLAVGPQGQRAIAQPIARGLGVLLDVAARGERADQALHDCRTEAQPARNLAHADVSAFGLDHLQCVETALQRLRTRRPLDIAPRRARFGGDRAPHGAPPVAVYGLLDLDDVGDGDLLVQDRVQRDVVAGRVVVVKSHRLAHDIGKGHVLDGVLDFRTFGAIGILDRLGNDTDRIVAGPGLQVRLGFVFGLDLFGKSLVLRRIDKGTVLPGADRLLHTTGLDDRLVAPAQFYTAGEGNAH